MPAMEWDSFDANRPRQTLALVRNQKVVWYVAAGKDATSLTDISGRRLMRRCWEGPSSVLYGGVPEQQDSAWRNTCNRPRLH